MTKQSATCAAAAAGKSGLAGAGRAGWFIVMLGLSIMGMVGIGGILTQTTQTQLEHATPNNFNTLSSLTCLYLANPSVMRQKALQATRQLYRSSVETCWPAGEFITLVSGHKSYDIHKSH